MALVRRNVIIQGISGRMGGVVFRTDRTGRTILSAMPRDGRSFNAEQRAHHGRFKEAAAYAKGAQGLDIYRDLAKGTNKTAYNIALADWFHPPEILAVDLEGWRGGAGEVIRVRAVDDVRVVSVTVAIVGPDGELVERGEAEEQGQWWVYVTQAAAPEGAVIEATARDLPGNVARAVGLT